MEAETLPARLWQRFRNDPTQVVCHHSRQDGETSAATIKDLISAACGVANELGARSEPMIVAVCMAPGPALHAAFFGAMWAGHIPTILAPPSPRMEANKYSSAFVKLLDHVKPDVVITDRGTVERLDTLELKRHAQSTRLLLGQEIEPAPAREPVARPPESIALLQHSSGTTSLQKGVALSHHAILEHNRLYSQRLALTREDVIVSWLPLYHDMGLIACFLLPLLEGVTLVELSPFDWVLRPALLFELIHRFRGTLCWLPNFAFTFMANSIRVAHLEDEPLVSTIRAWINCSEPVYDHSMTVFVEKFAPFGARSDQLTACYAMAETVFAVAQTVPGRSRRLCIDREIFTAEHRAEESAEGAVFVSNGEPLPSMELRVCDDSGAVQPEGHVGELQLRGSHCFSGYFRREELTAEAFTPDGWYRTGDLGFLHGGEVYVTGRKKDLIIIQGRNFYPADIEASARSVEGVIPGRVVAFRIADEAVGTDRLVILAEVEEEAWPERKRVSLRIRNHVAQDLDCTASEVHVVPSRWLVKSSSGKWARNDIRSKYLSEIASPRSQ